MDIQITPEVHILPGWTVILSLAYLWMCLGMALSRDERMAGGYGVAAAVCMLVLLGSLPTGRDATTWTSLKGLILLLMLFVGGVAHVVLRRRDES